jgi:hypothetical protein
VSGFSRRHSGVALMMVVLVTAACTGGSQDSSPSLQSDASEFPAARATTPLEFRDALDRLDIFHSCDDPADVSDGDGEVYAVDCYVVEDQGEWTTDERGVTVLVSRSGLSPCATYLDAAMAPDFPIVTDSATFIAVGRMNRATPSLDSSSSQPTWLWPQEVWPEDVARVLGGNVVAVNEWCPEAFR